MTFREGNSQGRQPKDRASSVSPRYSRRQSRPSVMGALADFRSGAMAADFHCCGFCCAAEACLKMRTHSAHDAMRLQKS